MLVVHRLLFVVLLKALSALMLLLPTPQSLYHSYEEAMSHHHQVYLVDCKGPIPDATGKQQLTCETCT